MTSHERLGKLLEDHLDRLGIDRYILIFADPDSDASVSRTSGDDCWQAGALLRELQMLKKDWSDMYVDE